MQPQLSTSPAFGDPRLSARFWAKVHVLPNGCWEWTAYRSRKGYGLFGQTAAHLVAFRALIGAVAPGLELDHLCRNRACANPCHLEPVPHAENVRRGLHKGLKGEANGRAKLTERDIRAIRAMRGKVRQIDLGEQYGVTHAMIGFIQRRDNWKHV